MNRYSEAEQPQRPVASAESGPNQHGWLTGNDRLATTACDAAVSSDRCVNVLGSTVHLKSTADAIKQIEAWIAQGPAACRQVVISGFHALWEAHREPAVRAAVRSADLWLPDGIAPVWVARLQGIKDVDRATGSDVMASFLELANRRGYRSFFLGDTKETLLRLRTRLETQYPNHRIVGTFSPPFRGMTAAEEEEIIQMINAAQADVLWVGLGTPKQDCWIAARRDRLRVAVAVGVGAAFKFLAGSVPRCPQWIGSAGFEWAYRLMREPNLWRRDFIDGPQFVLAVSMEFLHQKVAALRGE